jgi:hypothetical protein
MSSTRQGRDEELSAESPKKTEIEAQEYYEASA